MELATFASGLTIAPAETKPGVVFEGAARNCPIARLLFQSEGTSCWKLREPCRTSVLKSSADSKAYYKEQSGKDGEMRAWARKRHEVAGHKAEAAPAAPPQNRSLAAHVNLCFG